MKIIFYKNWKKRISFSTILISSIIGLCSGLDFGLPKIIKKKAAEIDELAIEEREKRFIVSSGEWSVINEKLVITGTGNAEYLMWPREKICAATNDAKTKKWATGAYPEPIWDNTTKSYNYGSEERLNYPAFVWVEGLTYEGYSDWRLPTRDELKTLYNYGDDYVSFNLHYASSEESNTVEAYWIDFETGRESDYTKTFSFHVIAVRSSN